MQLKRKIFEYGIFAMAVACALVFGLLVLDLLFFIIDKIVNFDPSEIIKLFQVLIEGGNYIEVILILIWGIFFLGLFLVFCSLILQFLFSVIFRRKFFKELPEEIEVNPDNIAIVIPVFNEEDTIEEVVSECQEYSRHIVVVDDGSTDRTPELLSKFSDIHVITNKRNLGLGLTMKRGIEYAANLDIQVIVTIDADAQYRTAEIPKIAYPVLINKADLVLGSRFAGKIEKMPFTKKLGNRMMSFALSLLVGMKITDGQTGFRGISKDLALSYRLRGEYTYTQEMIMQARFLKTRIYEIPVYFDKRVSGPSRLIRSPIDYALKSWLTMIRTLRDFQPIWFFGGFGVISFLLGLFLLSVSLVSVIVPWALLIPDPFDLAIFSTILILIGAQFVFFGFLADAQRPTRTIE